MAHTSELRLDIVSGEWVVIATGRAKRPHDFANAPHAHFAQPKEGCPFENIAGPYLLPREGDMNDFVKVIPNKYPAFSEGECKVIHSEGIYTKMDGVGNHEVVITKDHERSIAQFTKEEATLLIKGYAERMRVLKENACVDYVLIFHNHGPDSGATIGHPHSQIIALPVVPPDVERSLQGSEEYYRREKKCVHCDVIQFELKGQQRIVYENEHFVVLCPFASKSAFEMRVLPKRHSPDFDSILPEEIADAGDALQKALSCLHKGLEDPSYNFFIHAAPVDENAVYPHYHWHLEIMPRTAVWAGVEIGIGMEISTIAPETAAEFLRSAL